jgi:hypothetical protein
MIEAKHQIKKQQRKNCKIYSSPPFKKKAAKNASIDDPKKYYRYLCCPLHRSEKSFLFFSSKKWVVQKKRGGAAYSADQCNKPQKWHFLGEEDQQHCKSWFRCTEMMGTVGVQASGSGTKECDIAAGGAEVRQIPTRQRGRVPREWAPWALPRAPVPHSPAYRSPSTNGLPPHNLGLYILVVFGKDVVEGLSKF